MTDADFIVNELIKIRRERKVSREKIALDLDVSVSTIEKYEKQMNEPSLTRLVKWARSLGYEFDLVLKD
jgi:transcriptional regulator with XRE-family HTH domain